MIIAGKKEHIIKSVIDYFKEKGIGQVDLQRLLRNLNILDENNFLPIIERRANGVFFDGVLYEDFLKFQEKVDGLYGEYAFRQKTKEQKELQKNEPTEFVPGKISVFQMGNVNDAIKYGAGTDWCISEPGNGNFDNYRSEYGSTFYYVQDGTRKSDDPLSRVMVDMQEDGVVELTDKDNTTGTIAEFGEDWRKYFNYLESKGVNTSQFVNKPITQEEIEENKLIGEKIDDLNEFNKLPFEYKFKYIGRGHPLTTTQLMSILNLQSVYSNKTKDTLINAYLNTGRCLPPIQKVILFENNESFKKTYMRRRKIVINQIHERFRGNQEGLEYYARENDDYELLDKNNILKDPLTLLLASKDIVVDDLEEFNLLLSKGVSLDKFDWFYVSKIPYLSEDFIRKFKDYVNWGGITRTQKLSEDFIREFKDRVNWSNISEHQTLSEDFIREFKDKVVWFQISKNPNLSKDFIEEYKEKLDWYIIANYHKLSENFIRKYLLYIYPYMHHLSSTQKLSEDFIREFKDYVSWQSISKHQTLSEDFIREFKDKVDWGSILINKNISDETKRSLKAQGFPI